MADQIATTAIGWQNKFSTTLTSGITSTDTTIPLNALPTPSEGFLVIEPDSSTNWEVIYYTSKTGSAVVCTSAANGRGVDDSTAISHSQGATVRMDSTAGMFEVLKNASAITDDTINTVKIKSASEFIYDHVSSGGVITADAAGSTRLASITAGVVYINGRRHTFAASTSRTYTASKDVYVDLLQSTSDNVATLVFTDNTTNAASPALAANSVRLGIVVVGATSIAAAASINQGQEDRILPIASSVAYSVTDSLGNLICPRDPQRRLLLRRIGTTLTTASTTDVVIVGCSGAIIVPTGRKIKITLSGIQMYNSTTASQVTASIYTGATLNALTSNLRTSTAGTAIGQSITMESSFVFTPTGTSFFVSGAGSASTSGVANFAGPTLTVELM